MGLDDVEIYMDLEDRFHIPFDIGREYDGTVGMIIKYYQDRFNISYFNSQKYKILNYKFPNGDNISNSDYNAFAQYMGWPKVRWFVPGRNPGSRKSIIEKFDKNINEIDFSLSVSLEVKRIIAERIRYKGEILDSHNLYKDLGAG